MGPVVAMSWLDSAGDEEESDDAWGTVFGVGLSEAMPQQ